MREVEVGDVIDGRSVLRIGTYRGAYPQWFNVVLTVSSPYTRSGTVEYAYNDEALRAKTPSRQGVSDA